MNDRPLYSVSKSEPYLTTVTGEPWLTDDDYVEFDGLERKRGWWLFRHLSGSGLRVARGMSEGEVRERRQTRFLIVAAVLFAVWLCLLIF